MLDLYTVLKCLNLFHTVFILFAGLLSPSRIRDPCCVSTAHSFLVLNVVPLYTIGVHVHLVDIRALSSLRLIQVKLLRMST